MIRPACMFVSVFICVMTVLCPCHCGAQTVSGKEAEQIEFASGLFERGLYDMAVAEYQEFINMYGQSPLLMEAYFGRAESLFFAHNYQEAINGFNKVITLQGASDKVAVSYLRIAQSYHESGDFQNALKSYAAVKIADLPEEFSQIYYYSYSRTLRATGDVPGAIINLEKASALKAAPKDSAAVMLDLAELYGQNDRVEDGLALYQRIYKENDDPQIKSLALYKKGELAFRAGQFEIARETFFAVLDAFKKEPIAKDALKGLMLSLYEMKRYEEIVQAYEANKEDLAVSADYFDVLFAVGSSYLARGDHERASVIWNEILTKTSLGDEEKRLVLLKQAETLMRSGHPADITGFLSQHSTELQGAQDKIAYLGAESLYAAANYPEAVEAYKNFMKDFAQSPLVPDALYGLAYALKKIDKDEAAADAFNEYVHATTDKERKEEALYNAILLNAKLDRTPETIAMAEAYAKEFTQGIYLKEVLFLLGTFSQKNRDHARAVEVYKQYIDMYPDDARKDDVAFLAAFNLQHLGKTDEAIGLYEKTINEGRKRDVVFSALKNLGLIEMDRGNQKRAVELFDRMVREYGDMQINGDIYTWLAEKYHKAKQFDDIISLMDLAKSADAKAVNPGLLYFVGEALRETGRCDDALVNYQMSIDAGGPTLDYTGASRIGKAKCLVIQGKFNEAKTELEPVLMTFTGDDTMMMRARFELGDIAREAGHWEEAYKFYMLVAVLYTDDQYTPEALYQAGMIFNKLGKNEEAKKAFSELREKYPSSPRAQEAETSTGNGPS